MDKDELYRLFQQWIKEGLVIYSPYLGGNATAYHASGEAAKTLVEQTPLHVAGYNTNTPGRGILLTNELKEFFGHERFIALCNEAQGHSNDNEKSPGR